jgi:nicotinamide-nucleotide amidase
VRFLIISGGIGPTDDDLTRQALAACMNVPLETNDGWLHHLHAFFKKLGREMPPTNAIQAKIPRGATLIENTAGTAAGIDATFVTGDQKTVCRVFVMPGVPKEMKAMFTRDVLRSSSEAGGGAVILSRTLHTFGMGESWVAEKLGPLMMRQKNPSVGTTVSHGIVSLRINARFPTRDEAQRQLDETTRACEAALGDLVFGRDDDTLAKVIAASLAPSRKTVTTAESCTGGLLAKMLTDIPGSSDYFRQGWVTYSNDAKYDRLGVAREMLNVYGAVSEPVVDAMARNARRLAKADFALADLRHRRPGRRIGDEAGRHGLHRAGVCESPRARTARPRPARPSGARGFRRPRPHLHVLRRPRNDPRPQREDGAGVAALPPAGPAGAVLNNLRRPHRVATIRNMPKPVTMQTWRGCPCLDFNMLLFFARASLDDAAAAFTKTFKTKSWVKDVMEKKVKASDPAYLAYQFAGHAWTTFDLLTSVSRHPTPKPQAAEKFSKTLGARAMLLKVSDTGGYYEYALYDAGRLVQRYRNAEGQVQFESADKKVKPPKPGNVTKHFDEFVRSQDLLVPPFGTMAMWFDIPLLSEKPFDLRIEEEEEFNADDVPRADLICLA